MAYKYHSRRTAKRFVHKSKAKFILTLIIVTVLLYSTFAWILPFLIDGINSIKNSTKPQVKKDLNNSSASELPPPVLNIPFETTNSAQISITGFSTPDSKVKLFIDDEEKRTVDIDSSGNFIFENVPLAIGTNNIYGKTVDNDNKEGLASKTIKLIFDNEKPKLDLSEPEDNKKIQGGDKKVKVSGKTDPGVKIFVSDTQVIVDKDGNFSYDLPINEGDNTITIKAISTAANTIEVQRRVNYSP